MNLSTKPNIYKFSVRRAREVNGMGLYARIGMYSFIVGALFSVLDGAFLADARLRGLVYIVLIFLGVFAGILNITPDEEHHFLVSAGVFLIVVLAFNQLFAGHALLDGLVRFFQNAVAFVGSMALIVALKSIVEYGSENVVADPKQSMEFRTARIEDWQLTPAMRRWHFVVFLAVAAAFIVFLLGLPFYAVPTGFAKLLGLLEWAVIGVFLVDLVILYRKERGGFFKNCWIDIIAAIPLPGLGVLKAIRVARFVRVARVTHSLKFFSEKSGINTYLREKPRRTEPLEVPEHPRAERRGRKG